MAYYSRRQSLLKSIRHYDSSIRVFSRKIANAEAWIGQFEDELKRQQDWTNRGRVVAARIRELNDSIRNYRVKIAEAEQKIIDLTGLIVELERDQEEGDQ